MILLYHMIPVTSYLIYYAWNGTTKNFQQLFVLKIKSSSGECVFWVRVCVCVCIFCVWAYVCVFFACLRVFIYCHPPVDLVHATRGRASSSHKGYESILTRSSIQNFHLFIQKNNFLMIVNDVLMIFYDFFIDFHGF